VCFKSYKKWVWRENIWVTHFYGIVCKREAKEDTNTATILIINHNDWTPQQIPLTTSGDIHTFATIPPHTILYNPTPEWPKYYQYVEPSLTTILCIHNQTNLTTNLRTPQELAQVLEQTINTHIDTFPIKPTAPNYHIKFSNTWENAPTKKIPQITLPIKYYHQHHPKYHPQQCMYIDGSFIPPTRNSEGHIEGDIARHEYIAPTKTSAYHKDYQVTKTYSEHS
jgi:hypothetical protein